MVNRFALNASILIQEQFFACSALSAPTFRIRFIRSADFRHESSQSEASIDNGKTKTLLHVCFTSNHDVPIFTGWGKRYPSAEFLASCVTKHKSWITSSKCLVPHLDLPCTGLRSIGSHDPASCSDEVLRAKTMSWVIQLLGNEPSRWTYFWIFTSCKLTLYCINKTSSLLWARRECWSISEFYSHFHFN